MKTVTVTMATGAPSQGGALAAGPVLVVVEHPERARIGHRLSLEHGRALRIGRRAPDFGPEPLRDPGISSEHVEVRVDDTHLVLSDLGSKNGVRVAGGNNGTSERVERVTLEPGAFFQIGGTFLRYVIEPPFPTEADSDLAGISFAMHQLRAAIAATGEHDRPVLITGPTGTGKEVVARAVHRRSGRNGPLVALNCATLSRELAEAELFGHVKGAFTGAERERPGLFRSAAGGTVFLDEIGTLPLELQPKLLRVLQERAVRAVGASREETVDARVVAATNERLADNVKSGAFREDLFARLIGSRIVVPSLDERREDIVLLARTVVTRAGHSEMTFSPELVWRLVESQWPLNVRALEEILLAAAPHAKDGVLDVTDDLVARLDEQAELASREPDAPALQPPSATKPEATKSRGYTKQPTRDDFVAALEKAKGNVAEIAEAFGVRRQQIYRWAETLDVDLAAHRTRAR
jgi:transcriptional regulator with GAF, ATPase, and Fis domain